MPYDTTTCEAAHAKCGELLTEALANHRLRDKVLDMHVKLKEKMCFFPAAKKKHHHQRGGYIIHVKEVMELMHGFVTTGYGMGHVGLADAMLAAYVHDIDKLERYEQVIQEPASQKQIDYANNLQIPSAHTYTKQALSALIEHAKNGTPVATEVEFNYTNIENCHIETVATVTTILARYGIDLDNTVLHAVCFHEGGWAPMARVSYTEMLPIATLLHTADMISAKIWGASWLPPITRN